MKHSKNTMRSPARNSERRVRPGALCLKQMIEVSTRFGKSGHRFDTGPFLLDLYRLFCMLLGDERLAAMERDWFIIRQLRGEYVETECIRILTSVSTALRILFDQHDLEFAELSKRPCGKLFPEWPNTKTEDLTLREACNKIIHATKVNYDEEDPDPGYNPDQIGVYLRPYLYLYGTRDGREWKAELLIIEFAKFSASALGRFHGG
jgi:hypothetical protein